MNRNQRKRLKKIHSVNDCKREFDKVTFNVCGRSYTSISAAEAAVKKLKEV